MRLKQGVGCIKGGIYQTIYASKERSVNYINLTISP